MTEVAPAPAIGLSLSITIGEGRNLVFQSHIDRDADVLTINALLDKLNASIDRQIAKCAVEDLRHKYELRKATLQQLTTDFFAIEERESQAERAWNADPRRHGPWKRQEKDEVHRGQMQSSLQRADAEVKELKRMLDEAEKAAA